MRKKTREALLAGRTMHSVHRGTGISYSHVVRIFHGKRSPSLRAASKLAAFLGVSINKLYAAIEGKEVEL